MGLPADAIEFRSIVSTADLFRTANYARGVAFLVVSARFVYWPPSVGEWAAAYALETRTLPANETSATFFAIGNSPAS